MNIQFTKLISGGANSSQRHDSGHKHVTGQAAYIDDIVEPAGTLHAYLGLSQVAHGEIVGLDFKEVFSSPGVVGVLTEKDIPGQNDISPTGKDDDPVFAKGKVEFFGQPVFAVIAKTRDQARRAVHKAKITCRELPYAIDIAGARAAGYPNVTEPLLLKRGDVDAALENSINILEGCIEVGGQDHFYLEGHIAFALPGEDEDVTVYSSTQHPSEVQHMVAQVLGVPSNAVTVQIRRMGGGFGGKETQPNLFASIAAVAAKKYNKAVKLRPDRDDDMIATGKRHDFINDYTVGYDNDGRIQAVRGNFAARCGFSADLSGPVTDRALFHADNCYYYADVELQSEPLKTNTVSNTAFRGFGGPQGLIVAERIVEEIAYALKKDPLEIRKLNFYGEEGRDTTPYHQKVEDNIIGRIVDELENSSSYAKRRQSIIKFNKTSPTIRKGIALTPVKFGISFTATWFNQAGALVHIYNDGSIHLNHGGTEMGQGLNTKVAQILADEFQVDLSHIKISTTSTDKVPNTSATAASSGSDLNGMAAADAARQIKQRLVAFAATHYDVREDQIIFKPNMVMVGEEQIPFPKFIMKAYMGRVQLSAAGFYKTPEIYWDRDSGRGQPFYYFAYGAAVSEVSIDTLTGEYQVERTDILHDVGKSLNPALDIGQVEGAFIQGMGWLTTEELLWDEKGQLRTHAPSTYKIPLASDRPREFNVKLVDWSENIKPTIRRSKAVGEPPFMLAVSVLEAISMAVASVADYAQCPRLNTPATPENVLFAVKRMRKIQEA
ncbi:MAG: xanthine dehydrogenase molybdopterin binding subunit [Rhodobacteraceae bacterium]|nr:xanthine dehydrogenase molybdopterin binding subunit [Paracoccaceae bacterium]